MTHPLNGVARLPHLGIIGVEGEDAASFLQGQLTQDFALLGPSEARLAAFCSAKGRMQASFIGFKIPDLHFSRGDGDFDVKAGRVLVKHLQLSGSEADVDGHGDVLLREPIAESIPNLTLSVRPLPVAGRDIENVLRLVSGNRPPQNGTYRVSLTGTLGRPAVH